MTIGRNKLTVVGIAISAIVINVGLVRPNGDLLMDGIGIAAVVVFILALVGYLLWDDYESSRTENEETEDA